MTYKCDIEVHKHETGAEASQCIWNNTYWTRAKGDMNSHRQPALNTNHYHA
jgi:hypothetical protein